VIEVRQLRYFVALAEELHFSRAAVRLHIAQPALSHAIRKLESDVGAELIARTTRKVELTDAGRVFLEEARSVLRHLERMVDDTVAASRGHIGRLMVGYSPAIRETAAEVIGSFATAHPRVEMRDRQEVTHQLIAGLDSGDLDVLITMAEAAPESIVHEPLRDTPVTCRMRDDHPLAGEDAVSLGDLESYPLALVTTQAPAWNAAVEQLVARLQISANVLRVLDPVGGEVLWRVFEADDEAVLLQPVETPHADRVVQLPFVPPVTCRFELLWKPTDASPAVQLFLEHARTLRDNGRWLAEGTGLARVGSLAFEAPSRPASSATVPTAAHRTGYRSDS
jgi:DNA-binding transcriptional LysR family regulator